MKILIIVTALLIYLSIPGLLSKAGYSTIKGLIPGYNVYLLFNVLGIEIYLFIALVILIIIPITRIITLTFIYVYIPFYIADSYGKNCLFGILGIILPFLYYPLFGYFIGNYTYYERVK